MPARRVRFDLRTPIGLFSSLSAFEARRQKIVLTVSYVPLKTPKSPQQTLHLVPVLNA
jgi:hypothetical protein